MSTQHMESAKYMLTLLLFGVPAIIGLAIVCLRAAFKDWKRDED